MHIYTRRILKVLVQVHRTLHRQGPSHVADTLKLYRPFTSLRSASDKLLVVPNCRKTVGDRACSTFASTIMMNNLHTGVRSSGALLIVKNYLKSYILPSLFNSILTCTLL